jgi:peptide/nickel transport system ATP-binding protein
MSGDARSGARPATPSGDAVLEVSGLDVRTTRRPLVHDVSFRIGHGERVGLIGESGSGKSLTASSIMGLLPENLHASGSIRLRGVDTDIVGAPERVMSGVRGRHVSMVFQEPMSALNPVMRVGDQVAEAMLIHRTRPDKRAAMAAAVELLDAVKLPDPAAAARAYPHQLSGGQRQRIVLAIALANDPDLLLCDEPTTALDVTVQAQVLSLILDGVRRRDSALLFITHDLAVVATVCERVLVMFGGRIVEAGPVQTVFTEPRHPYTRGLLAASRIEDTGDTGRLKTIADTVAAGQWHPEDAAATTWNGSLDDGFAEAAS